MQSFNERLHHLIKEAFVEDVGDGDHSALSCIPVAQKGKAVLKIKQDGILAGVDAARQIFNYVEPASSFKIYKKDGEKFRRLFSFSGDLFFKKFARNSLEKIFRIS